MEWTSQVFTWTYSDSIYTSVLHTTAKMKKFNLLAQELVDSWQPSCFLTAWGSGTYTDEFLVPEPTSSCSCALTNFSHPFLPALVFEPEDIMRFLRICAFKRLYDLHFVFLETFLGFEWLQQSSSQSCHLFLINHLRIIKRFLLCHCCTCYRQSKRRSAESIT